MSGWIVETLVATSLLMLVVLLLRGPVSRAFGPRVAYALWLLPALRMILPPLPATVVPRPIAALPPLLDIEIVHEATQAVQVAPAIDWAAILLAVWLGGALLHFLWHLGAYGLFVRRIVGQATPLPMLDRDGIEVCSSSAIRGPFAAGIFIKTIVLPQDYRHRYNSDELRLAMAHEAQHHRRCDMSANLAALTMLSLHWFNPIAHRAHRAFRVDQEVACDAIVLAAATPYERHAYGLALLKSTCDRLPVAACALGAGDDLKRRLKMMGHDKPSRRAMQVGSALAVVLTGGGLLLTASGGIAAEASGAVKHDVKLAVAQTTGWTPASALAEQAAAADVAGPPAPPPVPDVPDVPDAPDAPVAPPIVAAPPVPPVPPVPPSPHAWMDGDEIAREVHAGLREVDAARVDVRQAMAEARRDIADARREAARAKVRVVMHDCHAGRRPPTTNIAYRSDGTALRTVSLCENGGVDKAEIRKTVISALEGARRSIATMALPAQGEAGRAQALANVDRKIAELKAQ